MLPHAHMPLNSRVIYVLDGPMLGATLDLNITRVYPDILRPFGFLLSVCLIVECSTMENW